jgi:predicted DCC family thiol-disulfide oxidoreductase YuxK
MTRVQPAPNPPDGPVTARALVLYDGGCPLCRREIDHYRRLRRADRLEWVDLAAADTDLGPLGVDPAAAMARFHVRDPDGCWQTGAWAFAELWSHLPGYATLARVLRALRLLGPLDRLYAAFARRRLARRCASGCDIGADRHAAESNNRTGKVEQEDQPCA